MPVLWFYLRKQLYMSWRQTDYPNFDIGKDDGDDDDDGTVTAVE